MKTRLSHYGRRVVRAVATTDGPLYAPVRIEDSELDRRVARILATGRRTQDERLDAWGDGKVLALGTVWSGEIAPHVDARLDALRPLVTGFTTGHVLHAEAAANSLDMGRRWVGDIREVIRAGARESKRGDGERVDLTDLAHSAARLEDALEKGNRDLIQSAHEQLRQDFAAVRRKHADAARRTADAQFADRGVREATQTRDTIRSMNEAHRAFWGAKDANGTSVPAAPASQATRTRDWVHQMPGGSPFINGGNLKHGTPRSPSVAEINQRNAAFWAERNGHGPQDAA